MKMFEIGKQYFTTSACDHECVFTIEIVRRTEKTVTFLRNGNQRRAKIFVDRDGEYIIPDRYSMAPVFRSEREVQQEESPETESAAALVETAEEGSTSNVVIMGQQIDNAVVVMIGQRIERVCGACFPKQIGKIVGFVDVPDGRFTRGGVRAVVRWDDTPDATERVKLSDIHRPGWRSANGSPLGVFVAQ